jgi:hypothetical protein
MLFWHNEDAIQDSGKPDSISQQGYKEVYGKNQQHHVGLRGSTQPPPGL